MTKPPRELTPKDIMTTLFEELLADDPMHLAERVEQRLREHGFKIVPSENDLPAASRASHYSG